MKRIVSLLLAVLLLASLLPGCKKTETIWIVMEEHEAMQQHVHAIMKLFKEQHPNVEFELEVLPNGNKVVGADYEEARAAILQRLRSAIMARKGPDIYLLPSTTTTYEMLFEDVNLAMRNGLFEDISEYYDADTDLRTEDLISGVMDAGVLDGRRYVLPLRYEMPVAYVDTEQFAAAGGSLDMLDGGIMNLLEQVLAAENRELAKGAFINVKAEESFAMNFLGQSVDYDGREVIIEEQTVSDFLTAIQGVRSANLISDENWQERYYVNYPSILPSLISSGEFWTMKNCMYIGKMQDLFDNAAYAKVMGKEIAMLPVGAIDGKITADVTYYGAVGDACDDTALAYEFLRLFLTEEAQIQWNQDTVEPAYYLGWPVRVYDDISALWQMRLTQLRMFSPMGEDSEWSGEQKEEYQKCKEAMLSADLTITNEDIPALDTVVDRVQFSIDLEAMLDELIYGLNDGTTCEAIPTDTGLMAENFIKELKWHLAEG